MRFRRLAHAKYQITAGGTATIPAGSLLFHGTIEPFTGHLKPGGDGLIWFSDTPKIAQLYIPRSGGSTLIGPESLQRPSSDPVMQQLQKKIGIDYDYSKVTWKNHKLESWERAKGWDHSPTEQEIDKLLQKAGYKKSRHGMYEIYTHGRKLLDPDEFVKGRLYIAKAKEPLVLWRKATGESDQTDLQYHDIKGFKDAKEKGLDGVLIDDFAQSKEWGNLGHASVGLFDSDKIEVKDIPAQYREWDYDAKGTPEYPDAPPMYFHKL